MNTRIATAYSDLKLPCLVASSENTIPHVACEENKLMDTTDRDYKIIVIRLDTMETVATYNCHANFLNSTFTLLPQTSVVELSN